LDTEDTDFGPFISDGVAAGVTLSWDSSGVVGCPPPGWLDDGGWGLKVGIVGSVGKTTFYVM
jgi:hypothetical protein